MNTKFFVFTVAVINALAKKLAVIDSKKEALALGDGWIAMNINGKCELRSIKESAAEYAALCEAKVAEAGNKVAIVRLPSDETQFVINSGLTSNQITEMLDGMKKVSAKMVTERRQSLAADPNKVSLENRFLEEEAPAENA